MKEKNEEKENQRRSTRESKKNVSTCASCNKIQICLLKATIEVVVAVV